MSDYGVRRDLRGQTLDLLRFPLAVVIVIVHLVCAGGFVVQGQLVSADDDNVLRCVYAFIEAFLRGQSVPIYFFISGYVFFLGVELTKEKYIQKLRNRTKSLLIPYLLWNTLGVVALLCKLLPFLNRYLPATYHLHFSWHGLLSCYWIYDHTLVPDPVTETYVDNLFCAPIDVPLWFVRELMIVVLCTPILYYLLRRVRGYAVAALALAWAGVGFTHYSHLHMTLTAFFFFSFGAVMSICGRDMLVVFKKYHTASMVLYPTLATMGMFSTMYMPEYVTEIIKTVTICAGLLFAYNLSAWLLQHQWCTVRPLLVRASFFIYVAHLFLGLKVTRLLYVLLTPTTAIGIFSIDVASIIINIGVLLGVYYLLSRLCPATLRLLTGRKTI